MAPTFSSRSLPRRRRRVVAIAVPHHAEHRELHEFAVRNVRSERRGRSRACVVVLPDLHAASADSLRQRA
jgi:hypothetical protein